MLFQAIKTPTRLKELMHDYICSKSLSDNDFTLNVLYIPVSNDVQVIWYITLFIARYQYEITLHRIKQHSKSIQKLLRHNLTIDDL